MDEFFRSKNINLIKYNHDTLAPYYKATPSVMKWWPYKRGGLIRGVASLEEGILVAFYYLDQYI